MVSLCGDDDKLLSERMLYYPSSVMVNKSSYGFRLGFCCSLLSSVCECVASRRLASMSTPITLSSMVSWPPWLFLQLLQNKSFV